MLDTCAEHNNLRSTPEQGVHPGDLFGGKQRLQIIADAMGWSDRTGCARVDARTCDTERLHNNPLFSEGMSFRFGTDVPPSPCAQLPRWAARTVWLRRWRAGHGQISTS